MMMKYGFLWMITIYTIKAAILPYTFIDFDFVHTSGLWENRNSIRTQTANDADVTIDNTFATSTATDNNGLTVGVFACDNQKTGSIYSTPNTAIYTPTLTFDAFSLEIVVKPTANDETFFGYIVGIEGTYDNIHGDSIGYNQINNHVSEQPNKFFPFNLDNSGWIATSSYWDSTINTNKIDISKFHHVIVTQNTNGIVTVYVDGFQYGSSYSADSGARSNTNTHSNFHFKLCGDDDVNIGFDGYIRAFGFYTESMSSSDALDACRALNGMANCETPSPTKPTISDHPTFAPSITTRSPIPTVQFMPTGSPIAYGEIISVFGDPVLNCSYQTENECKQETKEDFATCCSVYIWGLHDTYLSLNDVGSMMTLIFSLTIIGFVIDVLWLFVAGFVLIKYGKDSEIIVLSLSGGSSVLDIGLTFAVFGLIVHYQLKQQMETLREHNCFSVDAIDEITNIEGLFDSMLVSNSIQGILDFIGLICLSLGKLKVVPDNYVQLPTVFHLFISIIIDLLLGGVNTFYFTLTAYNQFNSVYSN
eukprot:375706_1